MDRVPVHGRAAAVRAHRQLPNRPVRLSEGHNHRFDRGVRRVRHVRVRQLPVHAVHHVRSHFWLRAVPVLRRGRRHRRLLFRQETVTGHRPVGLWQRHRHVHLCPAQPRAAQLLRLARVHADTGRTVFEPVRVRHADARLAVDQGTGAERVEKEKGRPAPETAPQVHD